MSGVLWACERCTQGYSCGLVQPLELVGRTFQHFKQVRPCVCVCMCRCRCDDDDDAMRCEGDSASSSLASSVRRRSSAACGVHLKFVLLYVCGMFGVDVDARKHR